MGVPGVLLEVADIYSNTKLEAIYKLQKWTKLAVACESVLRYSKIEILK